MTAVFYREECIAQADACRRKALTDPARFDYWIDEATIWLQRATQARPMEAVSNKIGVDRPLREDVEAAQYGAHRR